MPARENHLSIFTQDLKEVELDNDLGESDPTLTNANNYDNTDLETDHSKDPPPPKPVPFTDESNYTSFRYNQLLEWVQEEFIKFAFIKHNKDIKITAVSLGMHHKTLRKKLKLWGAI